MGGVRRRRGEIRCEAGANKMDDVQNGVCLGIESLRVAYGV